MINSHENKLKYFTGLSFLVHALFIVVLFIFARNTSKEDIQFIEVIPSVRVDVVSMPKLTLQELKKINIGGPAAVEVKPAEVDSDGPEFLEKKKTKSLMDMLKAEAQKSATLKPSKGKNTTTSKDSINLDKLILEGNKLSKGSAIIGSKSSGGEAEVNEYVGGLPDYVRPNWKLPSYLMELDLNCRIRIFLNSKGKLLKAEIFKSSGNQEFDQRAMNAVKMSRFPTPNPSVMELATEGKIILGFPL